MKKNLLRITSLIFCLYACEVSFAQSCTIDQSFTGANTLESTVGSDHSLPDGQSFKAGKTGALHSVSMDISASNTGCALTTMNVRVDILQGDGIGGTQVASQVYALPVNITRTLQAFNFDTPAVVTSGQMYTILFTLLPSQSCGTTEPELIWYYDFPTNFWTNTGGTQYQNGAVSSLGNTQYFNTCVGPGVGIFDSGEKGVALSTFPNPFTDKLTVLTENEMQNITIVNLLGETVYSAPASDTKKEIDLSGLQPGIYLVKVETMQGTVTRTLLKQ